MPRPSAVALIDSLIYQLRSLRTQPAAALDYIVDDLAEAETLIGPAAELEEQRRDTPQGSARPGPRSLSARRVA